MSNLPILYQNIIAGLPSQIAVEAFLWATERPGNDRACYSAEKFAREVHRVSAACKFLIGRRQIAALRTGGVLLTEQQEADLLDFFLRRHANYRHGGNVRPAYCEVTA